jgi:hypothetical protein
MVSVWARTLTPIPQRVLATPLLCPRAFSHGAFSHPVSRGARKHSGSIPAFIDAGRAPDRTVPYVRTPTLELNPGAGMADAIGR